MNAWMAEAACRNSIDPEAWFRSDKHAADRADTAAAVAICKACPVMEACLERAMADEKGRPESNRFGIFATLTPRQRMNLERRRKTKRPRTLDPCGTEGAYRRHYRAGEPICGPCREANREASNARTVERRARLKAGRVA